MKLKKGDVWGIMWNGRTSFLLLQNQLRKGGSHGLSRSTLHLETCSFGDRSAALHAFHPGKLVKSKNGSINKGHIHLVGQLVPSTHPSKSCGEVQVSRSASMGSLKSSSLAKRIRNQTSACYGKNCCLQRVMSDVKILDVHFVPQTYSAEPLLQGGGMRCPLLFTQHQKMHPILLTAWTWKHD